MKRLIPVLLLPAALLAVACAPPPPVGFKPTVTTVKPPVTTAPPPAPVGVVTITRQDRGTSPRWTDATFADTVQGIVKNTSNHLAAFQVYWGRHGVMIPTTTPYRDTHCPLSFESNSGCAITVELNPGQEGIFFAEVPFTGSDWQVQVFKVVSVKPLRPLRTTPPGAILTYANYRCLAGFGEVADISVKNTSTTAWPGPFIIIEVLMSDGGTRPLYPSGSNFDMEPGETWTETASPVAQNSACNPWVTFSRIVRTYR